MTVPGSSVFVSSVLRGIDRSVEFSAGDLAAEELLCVLSVSSFAASFVWFSNLSDAEIEFLADGSSCSSSGFKSCSM